MAVTLSTPDNLSTHCARLSDALKVATHLADITDDIRSTKPIGYRSEPSHNGTPRPVEDVVIALDDRGVTNNVLTARRLLQRAAELTERAAHHLDGAVTAWEGRL